MSMYRSRKQQKRWRRKWPWKQLFPLRLDERFCPECKMPYHEGPLPQEVVRCNRGNATAFVFPAGSFRRDEYAIRIGRWKPGGKQFYASEFIPAAEIDDVLAVVELAKEQIATLSDSQWKARRRSV
jgi:hypothetical protein